jgi:hypothetical protein
MGWKVSTMKDTLPDVIWKFFAFDIVIEEHLQFG